MTNSKIKEIFNDLCLMESSKIDPSVWEAHSITGCSVIQVFHDGTIVGIDWTNYFDLGGDKDDKGEGLCL